MDRLTYRYITDKVEFGSPTWRLIDSDLKAAGVYWFLTDPYRLEAIAVMVNRYDEEKFLEIVNERYDANFYGRELT